LLTSLVCLDSRGEQKIGAQLGNVLGYIEKLKEVDVSNVEPTAHAFPLVNVTRPDEIRPCLTNEEALRNAPATANGLFMVPQNRGVGDFRSGQNKGYCTKV